MGAPDLSSWIWPDVDRQRQPGTFSGGVNPQVLPGVARAIVGGVSVVDTTSVGLPLITTPRGIGYTGAVGGAASLLGPSSLVTSNGAGTGDFTVVAVTNCPASTTIATVYGTNNSGGLFLALNSNASASAVSGAVTFYFGGLELTGALDAAGGQHTILFTRVNGTLSGYVDGVLKGSMAFSTDIWTSGDAEYVGSYYNGSFPMSGFGMQLLVTSNKGVSAAQAQSLSANPWQIFTPPKLGIFKPASSGGVTGSGASTQQPNVSAASGSILVSGAAASTQQVNASSAAGAIGLAGAAASPQGKNVSAATGGIIVSGLGTSTQAANSDSASGSIVVSGSAASSQQANTSSASGAITVAGSSASTQAPNASSASGAIALSGSASSTQAPNVSNASGAIGSVVQGSAASTQNQNVSSGSGAVSVAGSAASVQGKSVSSAAGAIAVAGTASSTQAPNVSASSGAIKVSGSASSVQAFNVSSASGAIGTTPVTGSGASTQAANTSQASGAIRVLGSAGSVQTANGSASSGSIRIAGSAGSTQQLNVSSATGLVIPAGISGAAASVQQPNVSAATGQVGVSAYPVNPSYYVKLALRPFYAQSPTRQFCGAAPARFFYIKSPARSFYAATPVRSFYVRCNSMLSTIPMMSPKGPLETVVVTLDATLELAPGETLTGTPSPVVTTQIGTDSTPSLTLANPIINSQAIVVNGNSIAVGAAVQAVATLGQFSSSYLISATVTTSNPDKVLTLQAVLPMRSQ